MAAIFLKAIVSIQEFVREHSARFIVKVYRDSRIAMWKDQKMLLEELKRFLYLATHHLNHYFVKASSGI